jgi:Na+/proline symporter
MLIRRALRVVFILVACLSIAPPAYAYLDPGTGSMLVSALIGLFAAVALGLKMFWYRLVGLFRGKGRGVRPGEVKGPPATGE